MPSSLPQVRRILAFALVGGGGILTTPPGFSRIAKTGGAVRRRFFGIHLHTSILHPTRKLQPRDILGQVTSSGQVTLSKKMHYCAVTTVFKASIWDFQELIKASVHTKLTSRNFDLDDLRPGHFWDLNIIRQRENVQMPFSPKVRVRTCYLSP